MATPQQIAANRANSQKSTGPRTPEGKAKSSLNAVSYGFTGGLMFLDGEDPDDFYHLLSGLSTEHQPATPTEQILVEKMALNQWLSLRATRFQSIRMGLMQPNHALPQDFALFVRYQATADRTFHKAHAELLKVQKERKNSEIGFVSEIPVKPAEAPAEPRPAAVQTAPELLDESESTPPAVEIEEKVTATLVTLPQAACRQA